MHRKIEFKLGSTIESALEQLKNEKDLCFGIFNGQTIYSDKDDLDSSYVKVTGMTKEEFDLYVSEKI